MIASYIFPGALTYSSESAGKEKSKGKPCVIGSRSRHCALAVVLLCLSVISNSVTTSTLGRPIVLSSVQATNRYVGTNRTIVLSYLLYGPTMRMKMLLENALKYTEPDTCIVVHVSTYEYSSSSGNLTDDVYYQWLLAQSASNSSRIFLNPNRIESVRAFHGSIQYAQFLNYDYAKKIVPQFSHFVMMLADHVFFRKGMEEWIREHNISYSWGNYHEFTPRGARFLSDYQSYHMRKSKAERQRTGWHLSEVPKPVQSDFEKLPISTEKNATPWGDDKDISEINARYFKMPELNANWLRFMVDKNLGDVMNCFTPEGAFFPRGVVERTLNWLGAARQNLTDIYSNIEEYLIPTYVLLHENDTLAQSNFSAPIVARYIDKRHYPENSEDFRTPSVLESMLGGQEEYKPMYSSFFGIKLLQPKGFEAEVLLMLLDFCSNATCKLANLKTNQFYGIESLLQRNPDFLIGRNASEDSQVIIEEMKKLNKENLEALLPSQIKVRHTVRRTSRPAKTSRPTMSVKCSASRTRACDRRCSTDEGVLKGQSGYCQINHVYEYICGYAAFGKEPSPKDCCYVNCDNGEMLQFAQIDENILA